MGPIPAHKQKLIKCYGMILILLSCFLLFPKLCEAHPFHVSSMEMEWNAKANSFEVSVQLDPNDLERELRQFSKQKIILEDLDSDEIESSSLFFRYLSSVFAANYNGLQLKLKPVGFEVETKSAWIYFELPIPKGEVHTKFEVLKITNKFLLNQHAQTNNFLLKYNEQRLSATFHEKKTVTCISRDETLGKLFFVVEKTD